MKVRTLKPHGNVFGARYAKAVGDEYEHPQPEADIAFGYVEDATSPVDLAKMDVAELQEFAAKRTILLPSEGEGTGKDGRVIKADMIATIEATLGVQQAG
ncbi:hypothetical protein FSZ31_04375 [Sphingorhabdus soli]|uniref:Uncharacterized protein n=1 Tax=Flavisphingopyxis soli TaxID=2601267 RepID=A0A5C6ULJ2_9SPHN|nr:hypothetical protein [Sphingorhabdus soli]TXC73963.1 hypothetical protein FSZ31_04375 [Sphingorhabdus soli]